jgi:hypothetical protein
MFPLGTFFRIVVAVMRSTAFLTLERRKGGKKTADENIA